LMKWLQIGVSARAISTKSTATPIYAKEAELAARFKLNILPQELPSSYLILECGKELGQNQLQISWHDSASKNKEKPFTIDFMSPRLRKRSNMASMAKELIVKATGNDRVKMTCSGSRSEVTIFDLTAGLGRDAFIYANAGFSVKMFERNIILHGLLEDALRRLKEKEDNSSTAISDLLSLELYSASEDYERAITHGINDDEGKDRGAPDIVYLDPMYDKGDIGKRAAVKKETQILHRILGYDEANDVKNKQHLLTSALSLATSRVIVKRPRDAAPLLGAHPHETIIHGSHRADIYFVNRKVSYE